MRTGLTKKQKVTEVYYNAKDPIAEVYTHDTKLKKRLLEYAAKFPELCQQTDDGEQGGLRFEIDKSRTSIRLTALYSDERREQYRDQAKKNSIVLKNNIKTNPFASFHKTINCIVSKSSSFIVPPLLGQRT